MSDFPSLIFITGKGGVGKTTVALSVCLALARKGRKVMYIEWGRNNASSAFWNRRVRPYERVRVQENIEAFRITPDKAMEEYVKIRLRSPLLYYPFLRSKVWKGFSQTMPALKESVILGKLWFMIYGEGQFSDVEVFVFDGPSTGVATGMIDVPYRMKEAFVVGPMRAEAQKLIDLLEAPGTVFWVVTYGEELAVEECLEFVEYIRPKQYRIIFNRYYTMDVNTHELGKLEGSLRERARGVIDYYSFRKKLIDHHLKRLQDFNPLIVPNVFHAFDMKEIVQWTSQTFEEERVWTG